jgi:hypothetical protein
VRTALAPAEEPDPPDPEPPVGFVIVSTGGRAGTVGTLGTVGGPGARGFATGTSTGASTGVLTVTPFSPAPASTSGAPPPGAGTSTLIEGTPGSGDEPGPIEISEPPLAGRTGAPSAVVAGAQSPSAPVAASAPVTAEALRLQNRTLIFGRFRLRSV